VTLHLYPDQWAVPASVAPQWVGQGFIADRQAVAMEHNKPIILEVSDMAAPRQALEDLKDVLYSVH
jgi:phage terminase small subunit